MGHRRFNPRTAKSHRTYTIEEVASTFGVHKNTVRRWVAEGLPVIDARRPGHGRPSLDGLASAEQAMRTKGVMMDPVYTAKALAMAPRGASAVFWHTGGVLDAVAAEEGRL